MFGIWEGLSGNGWPELRSDPRAQGISPTSWDWIHLLRLSICFHHQGTSPRPGAGLFFHFTWLRDAAEHSLVLSVLAPDTCFSLMGLLRSNRAPVQQRRETSRIEAIKAATKEVPSSLPTETEGCHQSFPFLAIKKRLEDKKKLVMKWQQVNKQMNESISYDLERFILKAA